MRAQWRLWVMIDLAFEAGTSLDEIEAESRDFADRDFVRWAVKRAVSGVSNRLGEDPVSNRLGEDPGCIAATPRPAPG